MPFDEQVYLKEWLRVRDGDKCYLCGEYLDENAYKDDRITIDHVYPVSLGGSDDDWNLRLCHSDCNQVKAACIDAEIIEQNIKMKIKRLKNATET
jgi:5-methylcytosine-specific restriction endonuclease McrA